MSEPIESKVFKLFVKSGIDRHDLFNEICDLVKKEKKLSAGLCDSEHYEILVKLLNNENNAGWDKADRHSERIGIINSAMSDAIDRSEEFLP